MNMSVRARLFGASLALIAVAALGAGFYLEVSLRQSLQLDVERELVGEASAYRAALRHTRGLESAQALARDMATGSPHRLTLILKDGKVAADSDVEAARVAGLENHNARPEVVGARADGTGVSRRFSTTLSTDMLYLALRGDSDGWVVRAATPLREVEATVARNRLALAAAGGIALLIAIVMSAMAAHLMTRTLRPLVDRARSMSHTVEDASADEFDVLAGSFDRMSRDLERNVQKLARERDRSEAVLEAMGEAVIAVDADGRIKLANRTALELLEVDDGVVGRPLAEVIRDPEILALIEHPGRKEVEVELPGARILHARASAMRTAPGSAVLLLLDVTQMRRLEAVRRDFIANLSHELRNPISVIQASAEALVDGAIDDPERARTFAEAMNRHALRVSQLITDLLDLSRIESGRFAPEIAPISVQDVLLPVLDELHESAREHTLELDAGGDLRLLADENALIQVLTNLLDNAVKYTPEGGHIHVRARRLDDRVRIEVADDGPGIAAAHRDRLFERFYRVDAGRSKEMGGTGLGLAIVKHLAGAMDGRAGMTPNEPAGSVFWVELPAATEEKAPARRLA